MGKYENGLSTRKIILNASRQLFFEKGFHETSNEDICRAAHVNRSAINYHFKDKENLRYEIAWELIKDYRTIISRYCRESELQLTLAIYLSWCHVVQNPKIRKFHADYSKDYPVYVPNQTLPTYYRLLYQHIFGDIWPLKNIPSLSFSAIYGHLMSIMLLADRQPEQYTGKELFMHRMKACMQTWGIPEEKVKDFWAKATDLIDHLPDTVLDELPET